MPPKPDPPTKRIRVRPNKNKNHLTSDGKPKHRPNPSNKGFKVLGGHQARSGYLGKAQKTKDNLILQAKIKKSYAKTLKAEGLTSDRMRRKDEFNRGGVSTLSGGAGTGGAGARGGSGAGKGKGKGKAVEQAAYPVADSAPARAYTPSISDESEQPSNPASIANSQSDSDFDGDEDDGFFVDPDASIDREEEEDGGDDLPTRFTPLDPRNPSKTSRPTRLAQGEHMDNSNSRARSRAGPAPPPMTMGMEMDREEEGDEEFNFISGARRGGGRRGQGQDKGQGKKEKVDGSKPNSSAAQLDGPESKRREPLAAPKSFPSTSNTHGRATGRRERDSERGRERGKGPNAGGNGGRDKGWPGQKIPIPATSAGGAGSGRDAKGKGKAIPWGDRERPSAPPTPTPTPTTPSDPLPSLRDLRRQYFHPYAATTTTTTLNGLGSGSDRVVHPGRTKRALVASKRPSAGAGAAEGGKGKSKERTSGRVEAEGKRYSGGPDRSKSSQYKSAQGAGPARREYPGGGAGGRGGDGGFMLEEIQRKSGVGA